MSKLIESMVRMEKADNAMTEALKALETNNFEEAIKCVDMVLDYSESIEQRAAALFLMTLASAADPLLIAAMLGVMYQEVGGNE